MTGEGGPSNLSTPGRESGGTRMQAVLICDLVESTALVERMGDAAAAELIRRHDRLARDLLRRHGGREVDKTDGFLILFERAVAAVAFALEFQRGLNDLSADSHQTLQARIGIHVGEVVLWRNDAAEVADGAKSMEVEGLAKPVAARLMSLALPRQILLSGVAFNLAQRAERELGNEQTRWLTHGLYRFKGVSTPMLVHEVGEGGIAPLRAPPSTPKAQRELPWWRRPFVLAAEAVALLVVLATAVLLSLRAPPAIAFAERDWVILAELRNTTGNAQFDSALQSALRLGLEQSRYVNVLGELQERDALQRMERDPKTSVLDRTLGAELALREGARAVVLPTLSEVGGRIRFSVELVEPQSQTTVYATSADGEGEESILPSIDRVLSEVRGKLGESIASIEKTAGPLGKVTTPDMEALRAYSLAQQAVIDYRMADAERLNLHAIERDPEFASAHLALANIYLTLGDREKAKHHAELANRDPDRLSAREQLMARGALSMFGSPAQMLEGWRLFALLYPDAATGQQVLAQVNWLYLNDAEAAAPLYLQVGESRDLRGGIAWVRLFEVRLALGDASGAAEALDRARAYPATRQPMEAMMAPLVRGEHSAAAAALEAATMGGLPLGEVKRHLFRAAIAVDAGDLDEALAAIARAETVAQQASLGPSGRRIRLLAVALQLARSGSETAALRTWVEAALPELPSGKVTVDHALLADLTLAALLASRHGEATLAAALLDAIAPSVEQSGYANLEQPYAAIRCELHSAEEAIGCLEQLDHAHPYYQQRVGLWLAQRRAGRDADARESARWLVAHRGRAAAEWVDSYVAQLPNLVAAHEASRYLAEDSEAQSSD